MNLFKTKKVYKNISIDKFTNLSVYIDQRELNEKKIKNLKIFYTTQFNTLHTFPFITDPCVAVNKYPIFKNKKGILSRKVLFDGQHRLYAIKECKL